MAYATGAVAGVLMLAGHGPVFAQSAQADDESLQQKIIGKILGGLGSDAGSNIDYRERAPLVIPPTTDLPPPETTSATPSAWPQEPASKPKKTQAARQRPSAAAPAQPGAGGAAPGEANEDSKWRGVLPAITSGDWLSDFSGNYKAEQRTFAAEPTRTDLTEPPPGYQTPSPDYPYGIGAATAKKVGTSDTIQTSQAPIKVGGDSK
jgi:hypothetical protein